MCPKHEFLTVLQWLSPAFPIGSFAYSHGLEWAIDSEYVKDSKALYHWVKDLLNFGSARSDAFLISLSFQAESAEEIAKLDQLALALAASEERRHESLLQGHAFSRTIRTVWGHDIDDLCYPIALGRASKQHDLDQGQVIAAYLHAFSANLISAAIRLVPLGQTQGQQVLLDLTPEIVKMATEALNAKEEQLGSITFLSDVSSMQHETLHKRIFKT